MGTCEKKRERILMMLKQYHRLSVSDVVNALNASEATVRRYFKDMEKSGQLIRVCGGARLPTSSVEIEYHFSRKSATHMAEKQLIGRAARNWWKAMTDYSLIQEPQFVNAAMLSSNAVRRKLLKISALSPILWYITMNCRSSATWGLSEGISDRYAWISAECWR